MANEFSSPKTAALASRALRDPASLSLDEIKSLAASVLTQARPKVSFLKRLFGLTQAGE